METPIVIDACTLINLLRIDEDDNFLYKHLKSLNIHIAEIVYDEFTANLFKNALDDADKERLSAILSLPGFCRHKNEDIQNNIGKEWVEKIISYVSYSKKLNGELLSSLLALGLSREMDVKVFFYTDDYPAKDVFDDFFHIQQIGSIEDSVDLLLMLYWIEEEFSIQMLKRKLFDLRTEYNKATDNFIRKIKVIKHRYRPKQLIWKTLECIENAYYNNKKEELAEYLDEIRRTKDKEIKDCLSVIPNITKQTKIGIKIDRVLKELNKIDIFKL